jgi:hypothetical protein
VFDTPLQEVTMIGSENAVRKVIPVKAGIQFFHVLLEMASVPLGFSMGHNCRLTRSFHLAPNADTDQNRLFWGGSITHLLKEP